MQLEREKKIKATHKLSVAPTKWTLNFKMCKCFIHYGIFSQDLYYTDDFEEKYLC